MKEKVKKSGEVSRREFLKEAGLVINGAAIGSTVLLAACAPIAKTVTEATTKPVANELTPWLTPNWDEEADVVVCGYGASGAPAAIEAHNAGAEVILLEKQAVPGGNGALSAGMVYACNTSIQKALGVVDSTDRMYAYLQAANKGLLDPEKCRLICERSGETFESLVGLGIDYPVKFADTGYATGLSISGAEEQFPDPKPRTHTCNGGGASYFAAFRKAVEAREIKVMLETPMRALVANAQKEVLGVIATSSGKDLYIKARRAVILATCAEFTENKEMIRIFMPAESGSDVITIFAPGRTGDGTLAGLALGASLSTVASTLFERGNTIPDVVTGSSQGVPAGIVRNQHAILVNKAGKRFVNEQQTYHRNTGDAIALQEDSVSYAIFGDDVVALGGKAIGLGLPKDISKLVKNGTLKKADTLSQLAAIYGIEPSALQETVNKFNEYAKQGKDPEFGRMNELKPLVTSTWYGVVVRPNASAIAGLKTNIKAEVVDVFGKVIPRLYAAGDLDGRQGHTVLMYAGCGSTLMSSTIFGRIAGKNAAALEPWKQA